MTREVVQRHQLPLAGVVSLAGHGSVNHVFRLGHGSERVVVRTPIDTLRADEFEVEQWCLDHAQAHGITCPKVIARGEVSGRPYIVMTFIAGTHPDVHDLSAWAALGRHGREIHGFDYANGPDGLFTRFGRDPDRAWRQHLSYNAQALTGADPLLGLGVYSLGDQPRLRAVVDRLSHQEFEHGVRHGDLAPRNLLRTSNGTTAMLDWGQASVGPVPHGDLLNAYRSHVVDDDMTAAEFDAFVDAISPNEGPDLAVLHDLLLLQVVDRVRWALDRRPDRVSGIVSDARTILRT